MAGQGHAGQLLMPRRLSGRWLGLVLALPVLVLVLGLALLSRPTAIPGARSTLVYEGTAVEGVAPDFRLVNQRGDAVALSDFRNHVVALTFLDPECTDVCPLTALDFQRVNQALGNDAAHVVFLAVNANVATNSAAAMAMHWLSVSIVRQLRQRLPL